MCGIYASIGGPRAKRVASTRRALDALHHRGPDGRDAYHDSNISLGHTRLSFHDVRHGAQPISNEREDVWVVVNGEFYDDGSLRQRLEERGHQFKTESDSELLVHLYEEYGQACVEWLRGEFAFVVWDARKKCVLLGRDRFGIKPLCWALDKEGSMHIASEAKALWAAGIPSRINNQALHHCAHLHYTLPTQTMFEGIHQLAPGHMMHVECGHGDLTMDTKAYWDFDYPVEASAPSEQEAISTFRTLLEDSVRLRLSADASVNIGCYLSGGLDSCGITGLASRHVDKPITCLSLSFDDAAYDESAIAQEMAAHCAASFIQVRVSDEDVLEHLQDAVRHAEGLVINGHLSAKFMLSKAARDAGLKAVLVGEGADEIMAGYPHLRQDMWSNDPQALERLWQGNSVARGVFLADGEGLDLGGVKARLGFVPSFLKAKASLGHKIRQLLNPSFLRAHDHINPYDAMLDACAPPSQLQGRPKVHQSMYLWSKLSLAQYILRMIGDSTEMAHGIEGRLPFLDHKLVEFATTLPVDYKIRDGVEKYVQREALKDVVTPTVYRRQKHALMTPPLCATMPHLVQARLTDDSFTRLDVVDHQALARLLGRLPSMSRAEHIAYEPVLMFMMSLQSLTHLVDS